MLPQLSGDRLFVTDGGLETTLIFHQGIDLPYFAAFTLLEDEAYHAEQIGTFATTAADMVSAITMTYAEEAIGIARAAKATGLPAVISFTVETDGRLPSGQPLREACTHGSASEGWS